MLDVFVYVTNLIFVFLKNPPSFLFTVMSVCVCVYTYVDKPYIYIYIYIYTGCPRRNGQNFGRVFLKLNYTDITQNSYIQSRTVTEIMAREV